MLALLGRHVEHAVEALRDNDQVALFRHLLECIDILTREDLLVESVLASSTTPTTTVGGLVMSDQKQLQLVDQAHQPILSGSTTNQAASAGLSWFFGVSRSAG